MPFDGTFIYKLTEELAPLIADSRTDKLHQPSSDVLVLFLRGKGGTKKLLVDLSSRPCAYIADSVPDNPAAPPRFCTVLRKHLSGARVVSFSSEGFERVICLKLRSFNELGDTVYYSLYLELISAATNAVLVGNDGRIVDSLRRSDIESGSRMIQPGALYRPPEPMGKLDPLATPPSLLAEAASARSEELWRAVLSTAAGISPAIAHEAACRFTADPTVRLDSVSDRKTLLTSIFTELQARLRAPAEPTEMLRDGKAADFSWLPLSASRADCETRSFDSLSALCEDFFRSRQRHEIASSRASELTRLTSTLKARLTRKLAARQHDLARCDEAEKYRIYGELIKANIYAVKKGMPFAELVNYYDENAALLRVPLEPALSPAENAAKYFKEYKKLMSAKSILGGLIEECRTELVYIESIEEALSRAQTLQLLEEIREELTEAGYIRRRTQSRSRQTVAGPAEYLTPSGFTLLVGRNNLENDRLTLHTADKNDIWFHTKDIHGSHAVLLCRGKEPDEESILIAARLAAYHSKARSSSSVPVDTTLIRYVKKPSGARPGMVIYTNQKTLFVTPEPYEELKAVKR